MLINLSYYIYAYVLETKGVYCIITMEEARLESNGGVKTLELEKGGVMSRRTTEVQKLVSNTKSKAKWWIEMVFYAILLLVGQAAGTLLGRIYFINGGKSKWIATLVQVVGFPIVFPFQWIRNDKNSSENRGFSIILPSIYFTLGVFTAAYCVLYTIGLQYLPVTTYSLICASTLGFTAIFSYFMNAQKFTPYTINSILLLTISSILLVLQPDTAELNNSSKKMYIIGFICTLAASASAALFLSLSQLVFRRIIKKDSAKSILDMSVYVNLVASLLIVIGVFGSGDWRRLHEEMKEYKQGSLSYVMNLSWTAISWQLVTIGYVGLVFKVSALFTNVIGMLGIPFVPILGTMVLHEKFTGLKGASMVLATWGFVSYMYQQYIEEMEMKKDLRSSDVEASPVHVITQSG